MGLFKKDPAKEALKSYKKFCALVESQAGDQIEKEISVVNDLRLINYVINYTYLGRMKGLSSGTQKIIEMLFKAHARELINANTDVQFLRDLNVTLDADAKKDPFCVNQLSSYIDSRIGQLS